LTDSAKEPLKEEGQASNEGQARKRRKKRKPKLNRNR
jgi:hypothetical protein